MLAERRRHAIGTLSRRVLRFESWPHVNHTLASRAPVRREHLSVRTLTNPTACVQCPVADNYRSSDAAPVQCALGYCSAAGAVACTPASAGTASPDRLALGVCFFLFLVSILSFLDSTVLSSRVPSRPLPPPPQPRRLLMLGLGRPVDRGRWVALASLSK